MAQVILVEQRIEDGEKLLAHLVRSGFDVAVAFWVLSEEDYWILYIASNEAEPRTVRAAHGRLYSLMVQAPSDSVSVSDVRLLDPADAIAKQAIAIRDRQPGRLGVPYRGSRLAGLAIQEAYIYPKIGPMTRDDVLQTVVTLLKGNAPKPAVTFSFADGTSKAAVPVGIHLPMQGGGRLQFDLFDPATGQRNYVPVDDVVSIR